MSEERKTPHKPAPAQSPASATRYLVILFAAALVLLLLTFAMEKREHQYLQAQSQEQIEDLQQSSKSAVQSLQNLYDENASLKEQLQQMEQDMQEMNDTLLQREAELHGAIQTANALDKAMTAMDWFWQIDEAYVRGRYNVCRELIDKMTAEGLQDYLPLESSTNTDRFSPAHRLEEIQEKLGD